MNSQNNVSNGLEIQEKTLNDLRSMAIDDTFSDEEVYKFMNSIMIHSSQDFQDMLMMLRSHRKNVCIQVLEDIGFDESILE